MDFGPENAQDGVIVERWAKLSDVLYDERIHLDRLREIARENARARIRRSSTETARLRPEPSAEQDEFFGLALSGGGIRSATFSLGVLQALAQRQRLASIDYISTVSGGGYIGTWLSACIYRARLEDKPDPVADVEARITPRNTRNSAEEAPEIRFLRAYSNYLTPRLGLFSSDTLAAMSGFLRNLFLNLLLGIFSVLLVLAFAHMVIAVGMADLTRVEGEVDRVGPGAVLFMFVAVASIALNLTLQSHDVRRLQATGRHERVVKAIMVVQSWPRVFTLVPLAVSLVNGSMWICFHVGELGWLPIFIVVAVAVLAMLLGGVLAYVLLNPGLPEIRGGMRGLVRLLPSSIATAFRDVRGEAPRYIAATLVCAALAYGLASAGSSLFGLSEINGRSAIHIMALGPVVEVLFLWLIFLIWMGVVGNTYSEFTREWLNRFLGELSGLAGVWLVISTLIIHARPFAGWTYAKIHRTIQAYPLLSVVGAAALIVSFLVARSVLRRRRDLQAIAAEGETQRSGMMAVCWLVVVIFISALTVSFQSIFFLWVVGSDQLKAGSEMSYSGVLNQHISELVQALSIGPAPGLHPMSWFLWMPAISAFVVITILVVASFFVLDVNTFSLQNLYRNRLVRCYLGAAHGAGRLPNPFAGFDPSDDFALSELREQRPYLLVNAALNITQGQDLAWQQRKAASFTFSPRWCGYWLESTEMSSITSGDRIRGGFVRTDEYVHEPWGFRAVSPGVMAGTAIATSGAAVSSQMGFASRGPLAFVLTLMNLRLGRWVPNTAHQKKTARWKEPSPDLGAYWYLCELLGTTNERRDWVYVSDGGHFENLGIYELVRRRCARIFCVDAGADPRRTFSDLGNAVQKCRVDFGVDISIDLKPLEVDHSGFSEEAFSIGTIEYPATADARGFTGELVYLKPSLPKACEHLPSDVLAYRARHREFPHEATTNQWFSESQFESYRHLGHVLGLRALNAVDGWRGPRRVRKKKSDIAAVLQEGHSEERTVNDGDRA